MASSTQEVVETCTGTLVSLVDRGDKGVGLETVPIYEATVQKTGEVRTRDPRYLSDDNIQPNDKWPRVQPGYCEKMAHEFEYGPVIVRVVKCNHPKPESS